MKIILTQNVPNLGSLGDEVQVKNGYARNFLLPRGIAILSSGKNAKAVQHRRVYLEKQRQQAIDSAKNEAEKVQALEVVVTARAGAGGKLFGSVTNRDIQAKMAELGYEVDRKSITLHEQIRTLGTFPMTVKLHSEVKVDMSFRVEPEGGVLETPEPIEGEEEATIQAAGEATDDAGDNSESSAAEEAAAEAEPTA